MVLHAFAAAADDSISPQRPAIGLRQSQVGGVIVNPLGIWLRHDLAIDTGLLPALAGAGFLGDVRVGTFIQWLLYSNEFGVRASWITKPELLIVSLEGAFEPGAFFEAQFGRAPIGDGRMTHIRERVTAQATMNLKLEQWWFYSRSTASLKLRDFVEYDPYQNVIIKDQLELEQATAFMGRLFRLRSFSQVPAQLWLYGEHTVGLLVDVNDTVRDARPNRVSMGFIAENFPSAGAAVNVDVFLSFANAPTPGPGIVALYGFAF